LIAGHGIRREKIDGRAAQRRRPTGSADRYGRGRGDLEQRDRCAAGRALRRFVIGRERDDAAGRAAFSAPNPPGVYSMAAMFATGTIVVLLNAW
jgi:hypothetical protein